MTYERLADFVQNRMKMSHVYQHVMLLPLLRAVADARPRSARSILLRSDEPHRSLGGNPEMIEKRSCQDEIPVLGATVGEFWAWAYSDILNNTDRAVFAEFVVGMALGVTDAPRVEWDAVDLRYGDKTIEVKSAAYIQSWHQDKDPPSQISFDLKERLSWDAATNTYQVEPSRAADCYVFSVYSEKRRSRANVLDVDRWEFYVVPTERINRQLGSQQRAALSTIEELTKPVGAIGYAQLKYQVDSVL